MLARTNMKVMLIKNNVDRSFTSRIFPISAFILNLQIVGDTKSYKV